MAHIDITVIASHYYDYYYYYIIDVSVEHKNKVYVVEGRSVPPPVSFLSRFIQILLEFTKLRSYNSKTFIYFK